MAKKSSEARILANQANQANAQESTGPRSADGKIRSSRNACKHGLTATHIVIRTDEEREEYETLFAGITAEIQPEGALETLTFEQVVQSAWTLRRCRRAEVELAARGLDPFLDEAAAEFQDRLVEYIGKAERSYYKALKELRTQQTNRALREQSCMQPGPIDEETGQENEAIPALADVQKLVKIGWEYIRSNHESCEVIPIDALDCDPEDEEDDDFGKTNPTKI